MTMQPVNLNDPGERKRIAREILADVEAYAQRTYDDGHRNHLGASLIGHECTRFLWATFRWLKHEIFSGRMQRLFRRGHLEEARFLEYLRGVGFQVWDVTENGEQHRVKACLGHFGGSLDGINRPPLKYRINEPLLCEFKTSATGRGFNDLCENGVKVAKPQHYSQMCVYGKHYGFRNALYMCVNKNDDSLHIEIVELDWNHGAELETKAGKIIQSPYAPAKISNSPAFIACKHCVYNGICHHGEQPERNCRSCKFAQPIADSKWLCTGYQQTIPPEVIKVGCPNWVSII